MPSTHLSLHYLLARQAPLQLASGVGGLHGEPIQVARVKKYIERQEEYSKKVVQLDYKSAINAYARSVWMESGL